MDYPATTATVKLSRPFAINGEEVTEVTLREPTVRDRILLNKGTGDAAEKELAMISGLCGLNSSDLMTLPGYDYDQILLAANRFLLPPAQRQTES